MARNLTGSHQDACKGTETFYKMYPFQKTCHRYPIVGSRFGKAAYWRRWLLSWAFISTGIPKSAIILCYYNRQKHHVITMQHIVCWHEHKTLVNSGRAVASWFVTLLRMHMHAGSSPDWGTVRTGPLASLLYPSFFVLSRQCLKMRVLGVDFET